jgi:hypothetical protein
MKTYVKKHVRWSYQKIPTKPEKKKKKKYKYFCYCIGFVCDFIDFSCESLLKQQSTQLPAMKAVISHENF